MFYQKTGKKASLREVRVINHRELLDWLRRPSPLK
jgi:hypothetical protein